MLSGLENILYLKKILQKKYLKQKFVLNIFLYFVFLPLIFFIEFLLTFYLLLLERKIEQIDNLYFYIIVLIFSTLFIGTSSFIFSFKKYYHLKLYHVNIKKIYNDNPAIFKQYVEQISDRFLDHILKTLKDDDYNKFVYYRKNNINYFDQFLYIEKYFQLYPSYYNLHDNYYIKSKEKYEKIDTLL